MLRKDIKFEAMFLIAFVFYILFIVGLNHLRGKMYMRKIKAIRILENFIEFRTDFRYPVTRMGLHFILFQIFIMFSTKIFRCVCYLLDGINLMNISSSFFLKTSNNMQTSNVLVKTDNLINTFEQLFASDFVVCFFEDHIITEVMIQSPKSSILRRLFYEEFDHSNANSNEKKQREMHDKNTKNTNTH